jgi:transcriptional regulator with XRE-family HTH domain
MDIENTMTDKAILTMLGRRIAERRLAKNLTQNDLAVQAGVSKSTVVRIEDGASTQLANLIRILRVLEFLPNMDLLIPETPISPVELVKRHGKQRMRASRKKTPQAPQKKWIWGDEQ